jgi:hypothetical protein
MKRLYTSTERLALEAGSEFPTKATSSGFDKGGGDADANTNVGASNSDNSNQQRNFHSGSHSISIHFRSDDVKT